MPLLHIVILAIVQGISEFLPISSSGHLILTHHLLGNSGNMWDETLTMDIAVHVGTLAAIILYCRKDIIAMLQGCLRVATGQTKDVREVKLVGFLLVGSIPVLALGLVLHLLEPAWARSLPVAAWSLIIFGIALGLADRFMPTTRTVETLGFKDAVLIGLAQMLALIPGTSRSGITMTAARALGFSRLEAARFSFLLATISISAAGAIGILDLLANPNAAMLFDVAVGVIVAFLAALGAVHFLMKWLTSHSFLPFVIYRVLLGIVLLVLIHNGVLA
ncbi:MAG: undecaprenyl-diphosphate phosphatase [Alphaproteobacteria bacterium]|nr:undecaprenyl-diphosphate phosphatase [Alphaproteobacteria bacterium]